MMTAVGAVYVATTDIVTPGTVQETEQINLQSEAEWLMQILLDSPGVVNSGAAWDETSPSADDLTRIGLLAPDGRGLQVEKLHNLRLAPLATDASDGYANYDEARTMLGLDDQGLGFHVRASPTLPALQRILDNPELRDGHLKVTYIGDVDGITGGGGNAGEGVDVDNFRCDASPNGDASWRFSVDVTNGGLATTQFFAVIDIDGGGVMARQNQGDLVLAGSTETLTERESGGKPSNRHSLLEHRWRFDVTAGTSQQVIGEAWAEISSDGDAMSLEWSTDQAAWQPLLTLPTDGSTAAFAHPLPASGSVWIRVIDSDRTPGNRALDSVYMDQLLVRTHLDTASSPPAAPSGGRSRPSSRASAARRPRSSR